MEFIEFTNNSITLLEMLGDIRHNYLWVAFVVGGVAFLIFYVLESIALFTIAKKNGFKNKWMACVPILNTYYIGVLAEKNKTFNAKTKYFSLALSIVEAVNLVFAILYYVSISLLFSSPDYVNAYYTATSEVISNPFAYKYELGDLPSSLNWAWWVFNAYDTYLVSIFDLAYIILLVFVLSAFFRTYAPKNYFIFTILSVILPIMQILFLCVRNNKATNYVDYVKEMQKRQYEAYQEYMRNMGGFNQGGYNNNGGYNNGAGQGQPSQPEDPFGGLGEQSNKGNTPSEDDPFGDLK
ncbi:MAG: hypothetical protein ACI4MN_04490 [Candidatus Coproplasma sp.]